MGQPGRNVISYASGYDDSVIAGADTEWLMVGATLDWATAQTASVDTTLIGGRLVKAGQKYFKTGQPMARIVATKKFGRYDPAAVTAGTQSIARGDFGILDQARVLNGTLGIGDRDDYHTGLITGGHVWGGALVQVGTGTATVDAGPTRATLEAALPTLKLLFRS